MKFLRNINIVFAFVIVLQLLLILGIPYLSFTPKASEKIQGETLQMDVIPSYENLGNSTLRLHKATTSMEFPDLRREIVVYGKSERPDRDTLKEKLHIGLQGTPHCKTCSIGEKIYLSSSCKGEQRELIFSPDNKKSDFWIKAEALEEDIFINVFKKNPEGKTLRGEKSASRFSPKKIKFPYTENSSWKLGEQTVDSGILARQKTRWYGKDLFIKEHGGEEFSSLKEKERIDFEIGGNSFFCFVKEGDSLIWSDNRWQAISDETDSRNFPLLHFHKIEERILHCDLWDIQGLVKIPLHLAKSIEIWFPHRLEQELKFVGSKTRKQSIIEMKQERTVVVPNDWLLFQDESFHKLSSEEEINAYVSHHLKGELLVFDGVFRQRGQQILLSHLFNNSRTEMYVIETPLLQTQNGYTFPVGKNYAEEKHLRQNANEAIEKLESFKREFPPISYKKNLEWESEDKKPLMKTPQTIRGCSFKNTEEKRND